MPLPPSTSCHDKMTLWGCYETQGTGQREARHGAVQEGGEMTQPSLFTTQPPRKPKWVPDTSRAAHTEAVATGRISQRCHDVLALILASEWAGPLTSAELNHGVDDMRMLLYVRRGLSDLLKLGMVRKAGDRKCRVTNRMCHTWAKVTR